MIIHPFRGILYNKKKIKNPADVFSPPYDIISPAEQVAYYRKSPYNVIRLELNKASKRDNSKNNVYTRAAGFFDSWMRNGILERDDKPAIYIYAKTFLHNGKKRNTFGFIAVAKIDKSRHSHVRPHEHTFTAPKEDREKVLDIVGVNLSCIYTLVEDQGLKINRLLREASKARPFIDVKFDKVRHRIWKMSGEKELKKLQQFMKNKQAFIADGHHRYEAAANFRDKNNTPSANYVMMYFASIEDKNLTILPTHRVVKKLPRIPENIFDITPVLNKKKMLEALDKNFGKAHIFGMYADGKFSALKLRNSEKLDVELLHDLILQGAKDIYYTRDAAEAVELVNKKQYKAAFFLNPTRAEEIKDASIRGEKMPHKSTYFYPKLLTGLVMRSLKNLGDFIDV